MEVEPVVGYKALQVLLPTPRCARMEVEPVVSYRMLKKGALPPRVVSCQALPTLIAVLCPFAAGILPRHHHHLTVCDNQDVITHGGEGDGLTEVRRVGVLLDEGHGGVV